MAGKTRLDSCFGVCCQTILGSIGIATARFAGLAMIKKLGFMSLREVPVLAFARKHEDDEAISTLATSPLAGMTIIN